MVKCVSVVIPVYNTAEYVEESIKAARAQTYTNIEIIVIDDGSNERTKTVLHQLNKDIDVLISQENAGQSVARNKGIASAKGTYILIQDSDDYFKPSFIEKSVQILDNDATVKMVSCYLNRFDGERQGPIVKMEGGALQNFLFRNACVGNALFRKDDLVAIGGYDETMRQGYEDWELAIRLLKDGGRAHTLKEPLFMYRSSLKYTSKRAQERRPELLSYIFTKHEEVYKNNMEDMIAFFLKELRKVHDQKNSITSSRAYIIGESLLAPLRWIKGKLK